MTFLSIGPGQALALGVATAAAIAWLFFLRLRHPRLPVASLLLWRRAVDQNRPRTIVERLRQLVSLALALAIGLLLSLAPGRPATGGASVEAAAVLTIVVDTSPTMASRGASGARRLDAALLRARELIVGAPPATEVALVDTSGAVHLGPGTPRAGLLRALDALEVGPRTRFFPPAGRDGERVVFVTDGVGPDPLPADATRLSVFEPAPNVGIVAFAIRALPSSPRTIEAYADVVNVSPEPKRVTLAIGDAPGMQVVRALEIPPGGHAREVVDASAFPPGVVRASVATDDDGFALDDVAYAWMPSREPVRTLLVTAGNPPLETVLAVDERIELTTIDPGQFQPVAGVGVYVFDRVAPPAPPDAPALLIRPPAAAWLAPLVDVAGEIAAPSITSWEPHPVLAFVSSTDIRVDRALDMRLAPGAEPAGARAIATAGAAALIVTAVRPEKCVILGFDLADSDFPYQLGFPLFVENAISWLAGPRQPVEAAPGTVHVGWPDATITGPGGGTVASRRALDDQVFVAPAPGVYEARRGGDRQPIVVRFDDPSLSDVNRSRLAARAPADEAASRSRELSTWMLAAALLLVILEWWTFHRRITV